MAVGGEGQRRRRRDLVRDGGRQIPRRKRLDARASDGGRRPGPRRRGPPRRHLRDDVGERWRPSWLGPNRRYADALSAPSATFPIPGRARADLRRADPVPRRAGAEHVDERIRRRRCRRGLRAPSRRPHMSKAVPPNAPRPAEVVNAGRSDSRDAPCLFLRHRLSRGCADPVGLTMDGRSVPRRERSAEGQPGHRGSRPCGRTPSHRDSGRPFDVHDAERRRRKRDRP